MGSEILGAVLGSAVLAALLTSIWQRNSLEAQELRDSLKDILAGVSRFRFAIARCAGMLAIEARFGFIWESQRTQMVAAMQTAHEEAILLLSSTRLHASFSTATTTTAPSVGKAAETAARLLDRIQSWTPIPGRPNAVTTALQAGVSHADLAREIHAAIGTMDERSGVLVGEVARRRRQLAALHPHRFRGWARGVAVVIATLALAWLLAWRVQIQDRRVLWVHTISRRVVAVPLPHDENDRKPDLPSAKPVTP